MSKVYLILKQSGKDDNKICTHDGSLRGTQSLSKPDVFREQYIWVDFVATLKH